MTHEQLATLSDVYERAIEEGPMKLQSYNFFDLVGPYYTSHSGLDSRFTLACLYETMQALESVGFKVRGLVCDGASWNLSMVKKLVGSSSSEAYFINPFSDEKCWVIICPSHQVHYDLCYHI